MIGFRLPFSQSTKLFTILNQFSKHPAPTCGTALSEQRRGPLHESMGGYSMKNLSHPAEVADHPDSICFIMEFAAGGELPEPENGESVA